MQNCLNWQNKRKPYFLVFLKNNGMVLHLNKAKKSPKINSIHRVRIKCKQSTHWPKTARQQTPAIFWSEKLTWALTKSSYTSNFSHLRGTWSQFQMITTIQLLFLSYRWFITIQTLEVELQARYIIYKKQLVKFLFSDFEQ